MTPYEAITNEKPNLSHIRIIGSLAYVLISKEDRTKTNELGKLANKANKGILVGFASSNNYLVYLPNLHKVVNTRDIVIKEDLIYKDDYIIEEDYSNLIEENIQELDVINHDNEDINSNPQNDDEDLNEDLNEDNNKDSL